MATTYFRKAPADWLKRDLISHSRNVCNLYKHMSRDIEWWHNDFLETRYRKVLLRARFDKFKNIKDLREAKILLEKGREEFLNNAHPEHLDFQPWHPFSKEGISYDRVLLSPDYVMDFYHPLEKAQYPYYFSKREQMKDEYLKLWKEKMMKPGEGETKDRS